MIRINLLPTKEKAQAASQRQELSLVALSLALLLTILSAVAFTQYRREAAFDAEIAQLEDALKSLESRVKEVADYEKKKKDLDAKLKVIATLGDKRVGPAAALRDLARSIPDRAWLTDSNEVNGAATLTGQAVDNQTIAQFLRDLSTSAYFTNVDLVETTQTQSGDLKLRKFILKTNVNYAARPAEGAPGSAPATGAAGAAGRQGGTAPAGAAAGGGKE